MEISTLENLRIARQHARASKDRRKEFDLSVKIDREISRIQGGKYIDLENLAGPETEEEEEGENGKVNREKIY